MKVIALEIKKRESYQEFSGEIVGVVQMTGDLGKIEVRLRPKTVAAIFRLCKEDVQTISKHNASKTGEACENIADDISLQLENNELKQLGN